MHFKLTCTVDIEGGSCEWRQSWCPLDSSSPIKSHIRFISITLHFINHWLHYLQAAGNRLHRYRTSMDVCYTALRVNLQGLKMLINENVGWRNDKPDRGKHIEAQWPRRASRCRWKSFDSRPRPYQRLSCFRRCQQCSQLRRPSRVSPNPRLKPKNM